MSTKPMTASSAGTAPAVHLDDRRIGLWDALPILAIHSTALGVIWTGWSWAAVGTAVGLYLARMFVITAFYHRYFSHRTFKTHRISQFLFALVGTTAAQRGPLWWAAHHREHHRHADHERDPHSPWWKGVLWSHTGWFLTKRGQAIDWSVVPDWTRYRELVWLERKHLVGPAVLITSLGLAGLGLQVWAPAAGTGPVQMIVWGFGVSTMVLYHATFTINSLAHTWGSRRFATDDDSRNNWVLAFLTLGEGWHNNHHFCPGTVRQGFFWWEFDPAFWGLKALSWMGVVWDLRSVPARVYARTVARRGENGDDR